MMSNPSLSYLVIESFKALGRRFFSVVEEPNRVGWIETLFVSLLALAIAWFASPSDPLLLQKSFPWLLFAPLFLALRHGFAFGFTSALFFLVVAIVVWRLQVHEDNVFPSTTMLGFLIATVLAGEFSDHWRRRIGRVEIESEQRNRRMEEFTRSYHLLRVSHDQLVERLAGSSVSLRQAIVSIRDEMLGTREGADPLAEEAERVLALFRRYGAVQSASLHTIENGKLDAEPLGQLGAALQDFDTLHASDIINTSLLTGEMVSVLAAENGSPRYVDGNILAVAPISDYEGNARALLVIYRIPFLKFTKDNLSLIAVMGSYLGDLLLELEKERQGEEGVIADFHDELKQAIRYKRLYGISAKLVTIELPDRSKFEELLSFRRSLDKTFPRINEDGHPVALWLMPFCDDLAVAGFQARINIWARKVLPSELSGEPVTFHVFDLSGNQSANTLMNQVNNACNLPNY
ncbi:MAG: PelD GGDEF domain-containing protein [Mariprofundaceae bacterium]